MVESAICHGGHFLCFVDIRRHKFRLLNSFLGSTLVTNTEHTTDVQLMFQQMIAHFHDVYLHEGMFIPLVKNNYLSYVAGPTLLEEYPHVPNFTMGVGLVGLLSLCNLLEASNILHHGTYMAGGLPAAERLDMIQGRVWAREILVWLFEHYEIEGTSTLRSTYWEYLAHQLNTLCHAKWRFEKKGIFSFHGEANGRQVKANIVRSFAGVKEFWEAWDKCEQNRCVEGGEPPCDEADGESLDGETGNKQELEPLSWAFPSQFKIFKLAAPRKCDNLGVYFLFY